MHCRSLRGSPGIFFGKSPGGFSDLSPKGFPGSSLGRSLREFAHGLRVRFLYRFQFGLPENREFLLLWSGFLYS
jgi:hypothetical protein